MPGNAKVQVNIGSLTSSDNPILHRVPKLLLSIQYNDDTLHYKML